MSKRTRKETKKQKKYEEANTTKEEAKQKKGKLFKVEAGGPSVQDKIYLSATPDVVAANPFYRKAKEGKAALKTGKHGPKGSSKGK